MIFFQQKKIERSPSLFRPLILLGILLISFNIVGSEASGFTWFWETKVEAPGDSWNHRWIGKGWEPGQNLRRDIPQSHFIHTQKQEIECVACHQGAISEDRAGMPKKEVCADCHEKETDNSLLDKKDCLKCHTFEQPNPKCTNSFCAEEEFPQVKAKMGPEPYKNLRYPTDDDPEGFSHKIHAQNDVSCFKCHGDVALEKKIPFPVGKYMPKPQRCFDCHAKNLAGFTHKVHIEAGRDCLDCHGGIENEMSIPVPKGKYLPQGLPSSTPEQCKECHNTPIAVQADGGLDCKSCHIPETFDRDIKPDDHESNWTELHGRGGIAELRDPAEHGQDCLTCHQVEDCSTCHETQAPRDHNNYWRNRGHGFMAASYPERCTTCHEQDFCVSCHSETAPRSHLGNWREKHCAGCHVSESLQPEDNCIVCHQRSDHITAPHELKDLNCSSCHNNP